MTTELHFIQANPDYRHFIVDKSFLVIESGWHYWDDANDHLKELKDHPDPEEAAHAKKHYKIWSRSYTERFFNCE